MARQVPGPFTADQFTPTVATSAADKAKFANQFVRFVSRGFRAADFPQWFYRLLSNTFGHIAHYDHGGFFAEFFASPAGHRAFLDQSLAHPCYGDPQCTFSDVERVLIAWLRSTDLATLYPPTGHRALTVERTVPCNVCGEHTFIAVPWHSLACVEARQSDSTTRLGRAGGARRHAAAA